MTFFDVINSNKVVLVEFYATWCPHCKKMMPVVEQVKELLDGRVPVHQLDIDKNNEASDEAGVNSVPTFIIYQNGAPAWRHIGEIDKDALLGKIESFM